MPIYEFRCPKCKMEVEKIAKMSEDVPCKKCSINMERLISTTSKPIFKGSGFFETDYKNKS